MSTENPRLDPREHAELHYTEHLIDGWMPARELHLLAGPSGAGKTSWFVKMLATSWERGESVMGHRSAGGDWCYFPGDRSRADVFRTLDRLNVDRLKFRRDRLVALPGSATNLTAVQIVQHARKQFPTAKLLVFEGMASYVPDGKLNDYRIVANFLKTLQAEAERLDMTIVGVVHSPKMTEKDRYSNPRERVMGSGAWAAYSNLILLLEPSDPDKANSVRTLYVLPRNAKEERFAMDWRDGLLTPVMSHRGTTADASNLALLVKFLDTVVANSVGLRLFTTQEARTATGLSDSSLYLALQQARTGKLVEPKKTGTYNVLVSPAKADDTSSAPPNTHGAAATPIQDNAFDTIT